MRNRWTNLKNKPNHTCPVCYKDEHCFKTKETKHTTILVCLNCMKIAEKRTGSNEWQLFKYISPEQAKINKLKKEIV